MHIVEKYRGSFHKHSNILNQLREYCKYKNLSLKLTNKILDYYKFKYNQEYFREDYIMNTISQQLKEVCDNDLEELFPYSVDCNICRQSLSTCVTN